MTRTIGTWLSAPGLLLAGLSGSAFAQSNELAAESGGARDVGATQQALASDFTDVSGKVSVRIKTCPWTPLPEQYPTATCQIESDYVLVGGGAEIDGEGVPGALITGSYPDADLTTWTAESKDHEIEFRHRLRAYAIGLKLESVSPNELRQHLRVATQLSSSSNHPVAAAVLPPGYKLIGGGAKAHWETSGLLLTESYPNGSAWVAAAKDHNYAEIGTVESYAIGITDAEIGDFGQVGVSVISAITQSETGYGGASVAVPSGWALTSVGGIADYDANGRLLSDLVPFVDPNSPTQPGAWVTSKDHTVPDSGYTFGYSVAIRHR